MLRTGDGRQDTGREVNIAIPNDDRLDVSVEDPTRDIRSITPTSFLFQRSFRKRGRRASRLRLVSQ
jgi:hypothetical protein